MKQRPVVYLTLIQFLLFQITASSQVKISGAECIVPGSEYQYDLFVAFKKADSVTICIDGGYFTANNNSCYTGSTPNSIRVTWNDNITKGKISVNTSKGNSSINVRQTKPLQGGKIDSVSKMQTIQSSVIPGIITCSVARGGSCSPSYTFQWEQSNDFLHWTEIQGANTQNVGFSVALNHSVFLRRRTLDQTSNTIAYSDAAVIVVTN